MHSSHWFCRSTVLTLDDRIVVCIKTVRLKHLIYLFISVTVKTTNEPTERKEKENFKVTAKYDYKSAQKNDLPLEKVFKFCNYKRESTRIETKSRHMCLM